MLENILNNVNATEAPKPKTEVKKSTQPSSNPEDNFKDLLQKSLSEDKKDAKTHEISKSTKIDTPNTIHNDALHPIGAKPSDAKNIKPTPKDTSSPTKDLINASLGHTSDNKIEKNTLPKSSANDIKSTIKTPQSTDKKLSDIKTLADEKDLKSSNIKLDKTPAKTPNNMATKTPSNEPSGTPKTDNTNIDNAKMSNASKTQTPQTQPSDNQKLTTQNLLNQKLKTSTTIASDAKKTESKPLSIVLNTIDEKELKTRKKFNQNHKIEYKTEGKTEKIAIIERGKNLPKNIVEPKIYQEKREAKLEALNEKLKADAKNQSLQEAVNGGVVKDIKLKNIAKSDISKDEKIEDNKEAAQKKN